MITLQEISKTTYNSVGGCSVRWSAWGIASVPRTIAAQLAISHLLLKFNTTCEYSHTTLLQNLPVVLYC